VLLFTRFFGLDRITVAELELADMLVAAAESAGLDDEDRAAVRWVIHTHTMQHVATASRDMLEEVRRRLGLVNASVIGLSHINCVGGLYALQVARYLLRTAGPRDKVLVLTGDKAIAHEIRLIPDTAIQGDAAAACLVGQDPAGHEVVGRAVDVFGQFYQCLNAPPAMQLEYKGLYARGLTETLRKAVADAGCVPPDVAAILPHNVNRISWKRVCEGLGIPADRVYLDSVPRFGHCYTSDPFINLAEAHESKRVQTGDLVLMAAAGLGASFGATAVRIGEGRDRWIS